MARRGYVDGIFSLHTLLYFYKSFSSLTLKAFVILDFRSKKAYQERIMSNQKSSSRDEDLLLQDFSRNVTTKSWALFIGNAVVVSAIPLCK